jgi:hypothetical protein
MFIVYRYFYFIILTTQINRYHFDTLNRLHISPVAPSSPLFPTQHQHWLPQAQRQLVVRGVEKEISNNLDTHSDQTQRITQVQPADSHAENKMWYACTKGVHN